MENITGVPIKRQTIAKWENGNPVKNSVFINSSILGKSNLMILYGMLCKFIDNVRTTNGLARINKEEL